MKIKMHMTSKKATFSTGEKETISYWKIQKAEDG
jgi:hypothetical protein